MKNGRMQCKDIPDEPVLRFLGRVARREIITCLNGPNGPEHYAMSWGCLWRGAAHSVAHAMPTGTPDELVRAKMGRLIGRGMVSGCACSCRGDFELTEKGWAAIGETPPGEGK